jgi:hypothetical protein
MASSRPLQRLVYRLFGAVSVAVVCVVFLAFIGKLAGHPFEGWFPYAFESVAVACFLLGLFFQKEPPVAPFEIVDKRKAMLGGLIGLVVSIAVFLLVWQLQ